MKTTSWIVAIAMLAAALPIVPLDVPTVRATHCAGFENGVHEFPVTAATVFLQNDPNDPDTIWEQVTLRGPTTVVVTLNTTGGEHLDTEIVSMSLEGQSGIFGGKIVVTESRFRASKGEIWPNTPGGCFPASSYFDVYVEVSRVAADPVTGVAHNDVPVRMEVPGLNSIPPGPGVSYVSLNAPVALLGGPAHPPEISPPDPLITYIGHARHTPNPEACRNGVDDDNDGKTDWPNDPGCEDPFDDSEDDSGQNTCTDANGNPNIDNVHRYYTGGGFTFWESKKDDLVILGLGISIVGDFCVDPNDPTATDNDFEAGFGGANLPVIGFTPNACRTVTGHHTTTFYVDDLIGELGGNIDPIFREQVTGEAGADGTPFITMPDGTIVPTPCGDGVIDGSDPADCLEPFWGKGPHVVCGVGLDGSYWIFINTVTIDLNEPRAGASTNGCIWTDNLGGKEIKPCTKSGIP